MNTEGTDLLRTSPRTFRRTMVRTVAEPSLYLDFTASNALDPRITFTRASSATFFNSLGVLSTAASGAARFTYNPSTLAPQGLLIEEQRTNSIRNNTMVGAVAGTPGTLPTNWTEGLIGLTRQIVGTGTENGITYVDIRISGTTTSQFGSFMFDATNQIAASPGQSWTESFYAKIVAGSTSGLSGLGLRIVYNTSGGSFISGTFPTITLTSSLTRFSGTGTTPASTAFVQPGIFFNGNNASGDAVDITLRIGLPQLEQGAFATSVIPTTTTALTRNADVATMTGTNFSSWYNASEGTVVVDFQASPTAGLDRRIFAFQDQISVGSNGILGFVSNAAQKATSFNVFVNTANIGRMDSVAAFAANTFAKSAYAFKNSDRALSVNGAAAVTSASSFTMPSVDRMSIGIAPDSTACINGTIRSIRYYAARLPDAQLVALTG